MLRKPISDGTPAEPSDVVVTVAPVSALDVSDVYHTNDVRIEADTPPPVVGDALKVQMEQVFILRRIDEVPERLQYPFVLTGYRHNFSFRLCLLSVFRWHNETVSAANFQPFEFALFTYTVISTCRIIVCLFLRLIFGHTPLGGCFACTCCLLTRQGWVFEVPYIQMFPPTPTHPTRGIRYRYHEVAHFTNLSYFICTMIDLF